MPAASNGPAEGALDRAAGSSEIPVDRGAEDRSIRSRYAGAEGTARAAGLAYLLSSGLAIASLLVFAFGSDAYLDSLLVKLKVPEVPVSTFRNTMLIRSCVGAAIGLSLGLGLRWLINWVRIAVMILSVLGFVGSLLTLIGQLTTGSSPLVGLISVAPSAIFLVFAFLLGRPATRFVFSPEYKVAASRTAETRPSLGGRDAALLGLLVSAMIANLLVQFTNLI